MMEEDFRNWLRNKYKDEGTINSRLSNCLTVCRHEGDLDIHFSKDSCKEIITKLTYSADDEKNKREKRHNIPIDGNIRNGTATYKQAVNLYIYFKKGINNGVNILDKAPIDKKKCLIRNSHSNWPTWELPLEDDIYQLAQTTTKYIRFLNPKIIEAITKDNIEHYNEWYELLSINNINPNLYLWEMSPCCFPGIRRHEGSKEIAYFKKQTKMDKNDIQNALKLDDNDFPKQIWSFIFRGKKFGKFGPDNYSLAHLIDHKISKNRMENELIFINGNKFSEPYYGLYTCPSNTIYIPNSLLKPTDFNLKLRRLLFQKAESLYKDCCNILPPLIKIPDCDDEKWNIENFKWSNCVGSLDNINNFLSYRNNLMNNYTNKGE